jgi:hypothetical protein
MWYETPGLIILWLNAEKQYTASDTSMNIQTHFVWDLHHLNYCPKPIIYCHPEMIIASQSIVTATRTARLVELSRQIEV